MNLEETYDRYGAQLYRHALALTRHGADAEDVLQNVFVKLMGRQRSRQKIRDVEAYLHTAVRREAQTCIQRRRRHRHEALPPLVAGTNGRSLEDADSLNRALHRLPAEQREVVMLHVYEDMPFRRIGELLEVSPDTAASRYRYGRRKLKEWLHGDG